jgi:Domain of unknown function (DUF4407)
MDMLNIQPVPSPGPWARFLIWLASVDEETLRCCPRHDWDNARAIGLIMVFTWLYQTALFWIMGERLFGKSGQIDVVILLPAAFIATFMLLIDAYMVNRSGFHLDGIAQLKRGGLDVSGGMTARIKAWFFLAVRISLSIALAQLTAVFVSLLIFGADINARIEAKWRAENAPLIRAAGERIDVDIKRASDAVVAQTTQVEKLADQVAAVRQNQIDPTSNDPQIKQAEDDVRRLSERLAEADDEVRAAETFASNEFGGIRGAPGNSGQAGYGLRYRAAMEQVTNAKARARAISNELATARSRLDTLRQQLPSTKETDLRRAQDQLPGFEKSLRDETAKLEGLKKELAEPTANRENKIRDAVLKAPDHARRDDGFLGQLIVLQQIAEENSKIAAVILLIDIVSFGFELAAVLAKVASYVPTTYATLLARDSYMRDVRIVDDMTFQLKMIDEQDHNRADGNTLKNPETGGFGAGVKDAIDPPTPTNGSGTPTPPKRKRGRPRKYPPPDLNS